MPSRSEIKQKVVGLLAAVSRKPHEAEVETSNLEKDLELTSKIKSVLADPYTKISLEYPSGIRVTMKNSGDCKTVKDVIDLVHKRANGEAK